MGSANFPHLLKCSYPETQDDVGHLEVILRGHILDGDQDGSEIWIVCMEVDVIRTSRDTCPATVRQFSGEDSQWSVLTSGVTV